MHPTGTIVVAINIHVKRLISSCEDVNFAEFVEDGCWCLQQVMFVDNEPNYSLLVLPLVYNLDEFVLRVGVCYHKGVLVHQQVRGQVVQRDPGDIAEFLSLWHHPEHFKFSCFLTPMDSR